MSKKQTEESLNYKKYRTLSKVPDDILRQYQVGNKNAKIHNKESLWKYGIIAVLVIVVILGTGFFSGLNRKDDIAVYLNENENAESEMVIEENQNILMADGVDDPEEVMSFDGELPVFGSEIDRREVQSITFLDTIDNVPDDCWDVSYDQSGTVLAWAQKQGLYDLYIAAEGGVKGKSCYSLFAGYSNLQTVEFNGCFDTSDVVCMDYMFSGCEKLVAVDAESLNTENVAGMQGMFSDCYDLQTLNVSEWGTKSLTNASGMFRRCHALESLDVSGWDTSMIEDASWMFFDCSIITALDVSEWDTSKMTDMSWMFTYCKKLQTLDVSNWDTGNVEEMHNMFNDCENITTLDVSNWDTSNVTNMRNMFRCCENITTLDVSNWDTSNVTDMCDLFYNCKSLAMLDTSNWDKSNAEYTFGMYDGIDESVWKHYE